MTPFSSSRYDCIKIYIAYTVAEKDTLNIVCFRIFFQPIKWKNWLLILITYIIKINYLKIKYLPVFNVYLFILVCYVFKYEVSRGQEA